MKLPRKLTQKFACAPALAFALGALMTPAHAVAQPSPDEWPNSWSQQTNAKPHQLCAQLGWTEKRRNALKHNCPKTKREAPNAKNFKNKNQSRKIPQKSKW